MSVHDKSTNRPVEMGARAPPPDARFPLPFLRLSRASTIFRDASVYPREISAPPTRDTATFIFLLPITVTATGETGVTRNRDGSRPVICFHPVPVPPFYFSTPVKLDDVRHTSSRRLFNRQPLERTALALRESNKVNRENKTRRGRGVACLAIRVSVFWPLHAPNGETNRAFGEGESRSETKRMPRVNVKR